MSGEIIPFRSRHELERSAISREQWARQARLQGQIERIRDLLEELEDITSGAGKTPAPVLARALASIEKARRIVKAGTRLAENVDPVDEEGDPQPDLDHAALEHLFRDRSPRL